MYTGTRSWIRVLACASAGVAAALSWSQSLIWLGTLGGDYSAATAVSADGKVVVGVAKNTAGQERAFRWTESDGMKDLGTFGGSDSTASDISANGKFVVGGAMNTAGQSRAFLWTESTGMQDLGTLRGYNNSHATSISEDGKVVIGFVLESTLSDDGKARAFRWTQASGMQDLGVLPEYEKKILAFDVSADGKVVVGYAEDEYGIQHAFRWTEANKLQDLEWTEEGDPSAAYGISEDGKIVVGTAEVEEDEHLHAIRWTQSSGMQDLGKLRGFNTFLRRISADGKVGVGFGMNDEGELRAIRWTQAGGIEDLNVAYASLLKDGSRLESGTGISSNGRYIVGEGYNAATKRKEAYLLDTRGKR